MCVTKPRACIKDIGAPSTNLYERSRDGSQKCRDPSLSGNPDKLLRVFVHPTQPSDDRRKNFRALTSV